MIVLKVHGSGIGQWAEPLFIESYDVNAMDGVGAATLTEHEADALRFDNFQAAFDAWKTQSTLQPLRDDGQPNRPLTAYTVEFVAVTS